MRKPAPDGESLARFKETLKPRSLAQATQEEYLRFVRKLAARHGGDPAAVQSGTQPRMKAKEAMMIGRRRRRAWRSE